MKKISFVILAFIFIFCNTGIHAITVTNGLIGHWAGDGNANDLSGNNNHGTLQNGVTYTSGKFGQAFSFDGVNDYVNIAATASTDSVTKEFTIHAWVKPSSIQSGWNVIMMREGRAPYLNYTSNTLFPKMHLSTQGQTVAASSTVATPVNVWSHVVGVYDGSYARIYINGIEIQNVAVSGDLVTNTGGSVQGKSFWIGAEQTYYFFSGAIDDVALYNRALNSAEITSLYSNTPIPEPGSYFLFFVGAVILIARSE